MWWGGSEGAQGGSPPPDPPAEQGDNSQGGDAAVIKQELGDLKDQFDEQQALIGHLKDMLKKKETNLSTREKEVQDYASRLARMKPRLGRRVKMSKQSSSSSEQLASKEVSEAAGSLGQDAEEAEESVSISPSPSLSAEERLGPPISEEEIVVPPAVVVVEEKKLSSTESSTRAKILLLRKQLQENRLKFQRQQKDEEKMVSEEMKQRIDRLRTEVEERDSIIQSLQEGKGSSQDELSVQKLYQQIVYKDTTILGLTQKVTHLEEIIQGHQESLSEKDQIIEARTEAVTLIAKAQDEKGLKTLEELEEVRYQMQMMQKDFVQKEQKMVAEKDALSKELKDKIKKINQLEESGRRLTNLRFEMSTRNAELQEKIVTLQTDGKGLKEQLDLERITSLEKDASLQELKQKLVKAEAHGQKKLKALEKQLRGIKQDGNVGEKILELQNAIAELEEEKGNLQLKLVDFDDIKVTNEKLTSMRNKLEDHVKQLNSDLDSQLSAITQLETEKIKLVEGINERENRIFDLEAEMTGLKTNLEEITQTKVTLDLRLCEVEEQRDTAEKATHELENQLSDSGQEPVEQLMAEKGSLEETLQSVMKEREEWEEKYLGQMNIVEECEAKTKSAIEEKDQKTRECKRLMNILTDKENAIATLSIQIDKHNVVVSSIEEKVKVANAEAGKLQLEINNLNTNLQDHLQKLQDANITITTMEERHRVTIAELQSKESALLAVQENVDSLNRSLNERNITIQNLVGQVSALQEEVKLKERSLNDHIDRLDDLESQIRDQDAEIKRCYSTIAERDDMLSAKDLEIESTKIEIMESSKQLQVTKVSLECELNTLSAMLDDTKNQLESSRLDLEIKVREIQNNQVVISKYEQEVCDKNQNIDELQVHSQDIQAKLSSALSTLAEKEAAISKVQMEMEEKLLCIENLQEQQSILEQKIKHLSEENQSIVEEKSKFEDKLTEDLLLVGNLEETLTEKLKQITNLEASVAGLTNDVHDKVSEVEKWQTEALEKREQLEAVTLQLSYIQSDSGSKDTLVGQLQTQLAQKGEEMSELAGRLQGLEVQFYESQQNVSHLQEQLTLTCNQLSQTQEEYARLQEDASKTHSELLEANVQYEKVTALASQFEEQLRMKSNNLETVEKQMASQEVNNVQELDIAQTTVQQLRSEVTRFETELMASKEQAVSSQIESSQLQERLKQIQEDYENIKVAQEMSHQHLETAQKEVDLKSQEFMHLQQSLSANQVEINSLNEALGQTAVYQQQYQQQITSLQEELHQAVSLKQQNESEIAAVSVTQQQRITKLEGDILSLNQTKDLMQAELERTTTELLNQHHLVNELKTNLESITLQDNAKEAEIQGLQRELSDHLKSEDDMRNSIACLQEEKSQLDEKIKQLESVGANVGDTPTASHSEIISLKEELSRALDQHRFLEEECDGLREDANTLKQQLQDARQTITHLQTSLATHSQPSILAEGLDNWGEVDLGAPKSAPAESSQEASSLLSNLRKSLVDKDEMLTMMQDQLKETLAEINTINAEKKLVEQQKQTAEANVAEQFEKWQQEREELSHLRVEMENLVPLQMALEQGKERIASLEQDLTQKQQAIEGLHQQLRQMETLHQQMVLQGPSQPSDTVPTVANEMSPVTEELIVGRVQETQQGATNLFGTDHLSQAGDEQDPASWFDQQTAPTVGSEEATAAHKSLETAQTQLQPDDPASWFNQQQPVLSDVQPASEEISTASEDHYKQSPPDSSQTSHEQGVVNLEELQYKLSWYEEQWSAWTMHYNQLQTSYQESEQKVADLLHQIEVLQTTVTTQQASDGEVVLGDKDTPERESQEENVDGVNIQTEAIRDSELALEQLREENRLLQLEANQVTELRAQVETLQQGGANDPRRLQNAEAEVDHLRGFETEVYELQSQVQAFQHQCTAMQNKLSEAETEVSRLREVEVLYGELQSCIHESETKREGSKSRVQELELMVQSAESEIARLRNEIEAMNQAEVSSAIEREGCEDHSEQHGRLMEKEVSRCNDQILKLQVEVERCQRETGVCKHEMDKYQNDSVYYKAEMERLENENQNMGDEMARARSDLQRMERENSQLRSELEVFEGELDRMRTACDMYEGEANRVRGDYEALSQANQMTEAEKESLESEVQRITAQNMTVSAESEHLRDEIQRLTEVSTSAETEIGRLQTEMERFKSLDHRYNNLESKYNELQAQVTSMESVQGSKVSESDSQSLLVEEVDWSAEGQIEDEHLQRSSSIDLKYQGEIDELKEKVIALEKEKNALYDEVQAAKLKSGKMLQKLKLTQSKNESLTKEIQKLKAKASGFSDLDQALEDEWKAQVANAESERDELKQKLDEYEHEKENHLMQIDVLTAAQEEYIVMKEDQDTTIKLLKSRNKDVEGQIQALEWRISELEETVEQQQQSSSGDAETPIILPRVSPERESAAHVTTALQGQETETLKVQLSSLHLEVKILKNENERIKVSSKELEEAVESLSQENNTFQSIIEKLKEAKTKAVTDANNYKSVYIELHEEHENTKKEKDNTNEELRELTYTHDTLKAAYNSLYDEYNELRDICDSHKHDIGILKGERDRLVEEVNSLKNQLEALHEEEEEEIIRALQQECFSLREQSNLVQEENTALQVKMEDALEKAERLEYTLEQNVEMQKVLQEEIMKKSEEISFHTTTIGGHERQMPYLQAEMAALRTKLSQQEQAEESNMGTIQKLEMKVEQLQEHNQQLRIQVEAAESSLSNLAGGNPEISDAVFTPAAPSTTELDAALASLHLRDLRCQQLSLEITKLLEERDALQLKLSASLRQTQELTRELSLSHQLPAPVTSEPSLHQKLTELRELNDSLERKALVSLHGGSSTSMGRRITIGGLQSPPIFTPHTAPPTPTATRHADYTLNTSAAREAQGTSTTLIDWIMGKSTPRVMHV